jgi:hypothetical protein
MKDSMVQSGRLKGWNNEVEFGSGVELKEVRMESAAVSRRRWC